MKVKNINSSSKKTERRIKEAFAKLMQEKKDLNNITVTELVSLADITRSSFYTHYDSIYDVAQEFQNETLDVAINNLGNINTLEDFDNYIDIVFNYLAKNEKIYKMMLSSNDPLFFINRINKHFNTYITDALKKKSYNDELILQVSFFTDGCMNLIIKYFREEIDYSLNDINLFIKKLFRNFFTEFKN